MKIKKIKWNAFILGALLVAGCGDDDSSGDTATATGDSSEESDAAPEQALDAPDSSTTVAEFCAWIEENGGQELDVLNPDDPEFQSFLEEGLELDVPDEIAEDWHLTLSVWTDDPPPDLTPPFGEEGLARMAEAGDNVASFVEQECGYTGPS